MRVLLDTNIIIHRENKKMTNYSIGHLFRWLDKLKCDKLIHPLSKEEIARYEYADTQEAMTLKLDAYEELKTSATISEQVSSAVSGYDKNENDRIDTALLNEVFQGRVDLLITESVLVKSMKFFDANIVLSVTVANITDGGTLSYQWQRAEGASGGVFRDIPNATYRGMKISKICGF